MTTGLLTSLLVTKVVLGGSLKKGKGKRKMPGHTQLEKARSRKLTPGIRGRSKSGTRRLPRGRLVIDAGEVGGKFKVVVGSGIDTKTNRRVIAVSSGGKVTEFAPPSDLNPVVIRRSAIGLKGKGKIRPRVTGELTRAKIRTLSRVTQRTLDRARQ